MLEIHFDDGKVITVQPGDTIVVDRGALFFFPDSGYDQGHALLTKVMQDEQAQYQGQAGTGADNPR
jgi:hypothetical protein